MSAASYGSYSSDDVYWGALIAESTFTGVRPEGNSLLGGQSGDSHQSVQINLQNGEISVDDEDVKGAYRGRGSRGQGELWRELWVEE